MRAILVFFCVILVVTARPDVNLGYRYPQPVICGDYLGQEKCESPIVPTSGFGLNRIAQQGSLDVRFDVPPAVPTSGFSGTSGFSSGVAGFDSTSNFGQHHHQAPSITKHFYFYSAPEEQQDQVVKHISIGRPQKNYRIIFIKAPATNSVAPRISASYAPSEEKTIIYVLSKKPDEINIGEVATPAPTEPSKPEVFFIKYNTAEEAAQAQQKIQAQYDVLGGTSQFSNEGTVQVSSVIGSLGTGQLSNGISSSSSGSKYLPPSH